MGLLIGGSMVLIGASAVVLVLGWIDGAQPLVWASIAASVSAGVMLALAYHRSQR
jgi:hypothetical protein